MAFLGSLSSPLVPALPDVPVSAVMAVLGAVLGGFLHVAFDQFMPISSTYNPTKPAPSGYTPGLRTLLELGVWFAFTALLSFAPLPFMSVFGLTMFSVMGILQMWNWDISLTKQGDGVGLQGDAVALASYIYVSVFGGKYAN